MDPLDIVALGGLAWLLWQAVSSSGTPFQLPDLTAALTNFADSASQLLSTGSSSVIAWANAIQQFEGWSPPNSQYPTGTVSWRNNNPGNLREQGDMGMDPNGFAIFSSYQVGFQALVNDLNAKIQKYPTYTIAQIMAIYAPASDGNNPTAYAQVVANALGVPVNTPISQLG